MIGQEKYQEINHLLDLRLAEKGALVAVHRGSWGGNIIENTIPAYEAALDMGADMVECDLTLSTDGVLYAFHDGGEFRLFLKKENMTTMNSKAIDALEFRNSLGLPSGQHVQRLEEILPHFTHGELINIDRAWPALPELGAVLRRHPHALNQLVIKTPVKEEYLQFFQDCPVKYMYMPIAHSMEDVRKVLSYPDINMVGVEAIAVTPEAELFQEENIRWIREQGLYVWTNAIQLSGLAQHELCGGYNDCKALTEGPDTAWGALLDKGYNVLQTDWPFQLSRYLRARCQ